MFLRSAPSETLTDVIDRMETDVSASLTLSSNDIVVDLAQNSIALGTVEVPVTPEGLKALSTSLDIPSAFLLRQDPDLQQVLLTTLLSRQPGNAVYGYSEAGLKEVRDPRTQVISPSRLLHVASRVIDPLAPVRDFWTTGAEFRLDVTVPEGSDRGVGGDNAVGDLSVAGIRIIQDRKHNLAPAVQPFQYRLFCTNGMSTRYDGAQVDARGSSVEEVLAEFETIADLAFRRAEADMEAFYSLRSERLEHPERTMLRMAQDAGLPTRTTTRLLEQIPLISQQEGHSGDVTTFDLINLMTNMANDPSATRPGIRLALEQAAGKVVSEHAERCNSCQSRLVH